MLMGNIRRAILARAKRTLRSRVSSPFKPFLPPSPPLHPAPSSSSSSFFDVLDTFHAGTTRTMRGCEAVGLVERKPSLLLFFYADTHTLCRLAPPTVSRRPAHPSGHGNHGFDVYCPPGVKNGTFVCQTEDGGGAPPPEQCQSGFDVWHRDCLNGTVYKTITKLNPKTSEGDCCAACSADKDNCAGWNMPKGDQGTTCQLMKEPLVMWEDGQYDSSCKAAEVDHHSRNCWYDDEYYNSTFGEFCDRSKCTCDVLEKNMPIGRELHPMCHQYSNGNGELTAVPLTSIKAFKESRPTNREARPVSFAAAMLGGSDGYWSCSDALEEVCFNGYMPSRDCSSCAVDPKNAGMLTKAGCTPAFVEHLCSADFGECEHKLEGVCAPTLGNQKACSACVQKNTAALERADCTSTFVDYVCQGGGGHSSKWEGYIDKLSCLMNGAWYAGNPLSNRESARGHGWGCFVPP